MWESFNFLCGICAPSGNEAGKIDAVDFVVGFWLVKYKMLKTASFPTDEAGEQFTNRGAN